MKKVFSILVENTPGVTSHISGLFSRRGYNIDSFSSGVTSEPKITRITIVASGDEQILDQIEKQVAKLEDVIDVQILKPTDSVTTELMLVKVRAGANERQGVLSITQIFKAKVVDVTHDTMVIEVTGHAEKLESFLDMIDDYEILELARTGITGLSRGGQVKQVSLDDRLVYLPDED